MNQTELTDKDLEGYLAARNFAKGISKEIINSIKAGMTEKEIEDAAYEVFRKNGVKQHWHMPIIGVGEGSAKLKGIYALTSSYLARYSRVLHENDIVLIDIAPVYNDYPADYTISHVAGNNPELEVFISYAHETSCQIAKYIRPGMTVADVFSYAKGLIQAKPDYTLAYPPFISMGHRLCRLPALWQMLPEPGLSYLILRANAPFVSSENHAPMVGLWVIEPYLMYKGRAAKFESLVFVGKEALVLDR
jgi:Xaa-Pro aminopeptidase